MTTHTASMLQGLLRQLPVLGKIHRQLCCAISGIRTGPRAGATHHESEVGKRADTVLVYCPMTIQFKKKKKRNVRIRLLYRSEGGVSVNKQRILLPWMT